ncbi:MAG TPA: DUF6178 family protein, partial [Armatimonadota bacterium]|nr:DUF6178 family protein [Armatimonadota bacterium]
ELVPPALVGALVQNLEEDNRYLLGDLSLEQFRALLELCSPERKYYWITTALSFTDARANALPLLIPTGELAEILLTRVEWETHLRALGEYPLEDARLPPEMLTDPAQALVDLFGAENLLRQFPVNDTGLAHLLQTLLDYDADRYVDLVREGLRRADYAENHPTEWEALTEDPVLLEPLEGEGVEAPASDLVPEERPLPGGDVPVSLVPVKAPPLVRLTAALPPALQERVGQELQYLYIRQAVAEGGSFHRSDLSRVARSTEAYLLLGLQAESGGDPERERQLLQNRPLNKISQSGARTVERLRQVALRLAPTEKVLDAEGRAFVRSLVRPRLTLGPEGEPRLQLLPAGDLPETADLPTATGMLQETAAWVALARSMGLARTEKALAAAGSMRALLEELALGAVLFGRLEPGLTEPQDRKRFTARYATPEGLPTEEARTGLLRALEPAAARGLSQQETLPLLNAALERLAAGEG